jgi:hypothetical protein
MEPVGKFFLGIFICVVIVIIGFFMIRVVLGDPKAEKNELLEK